MRRVFFTFLVTLGSLMFNGLPAMAAGDGSTPAASFGMEAGPANPESVQLTGFRSRAVCPCPCPTAPQGTVPTAPGEMPAPAQPGPAAIGPAAPPQPAVLEQPAFEQPAPSDLAGAFGAASGPESSIPNMIGDLAFGSGGYNSDSSSSSSYGNGFIALEFRRFKMAEDNNPLPTDRFFFNYNHYNNALQSIDGVTHDFDRYTFGLEKTFFDQRASVEFRLPFGQGLNATQSFAPDASLTGTEFGDIPLVFKVLLARCEHQAWSAGMAITFPTARNVRLLDNTGSEFLVLDNDAVHLDPFIGWLWKPAGRRLFIQAFGQLDFDTNGDRVLVRNRLGGALVDGGRYQQQNLGLLDLKLGYWLIERPECKWVRGVIPTVELHYTTTLQNSDSVAGISNPLNRLDILDCTAGVQLIVGQNSTLTIAGAAPLTNGNDRLFNSEFVVQFDRQF